MEGCIECRHIRTDKMKRSYQCGYDQEVTFYDATCTHRKLVFTAQVSNKEKVDGSKRK